jgi:hypothetical protein
MHIDVRNTGSGTAELSVVIFSPEAEEEDFRATIPMRSAALHRLAEDVRLLTGMARSGDSRGSR